MNIHSSDLITEILTEQSSPLHFPVHGETVVEGFRVIVSDTPIGSYRTVVVPDIGKVSYDGKGRLCRVTAKYISEYLSRLCHTEKPRMLIAGLGNPSAPSDALGSAVVGRAVIDGERIFSSVPLTKGQTGLSSASVVRASAELARADVIIAVDALAAREPARLGSVIQMSDGGILPGSGVSSATDEISTSTMPCPVLSIGVPTVIRAEIALGDGAPSLLVTPANVCAVTDAFSSVIAGGINIAALSRD